MSLTVFPTIIFDASGSDSAASGAGPATALTGTQGNVTSSSTTATITDAVDLSGVATDGSAVLWINTASGRQFSRISAISGSSGAWTLTVEDSVWTTSTNKTWGIGGKRLSMDDSNSRNLFTNDVKAGWTIQLNNNVSLTSNIYINNGGDTTNGPVTLVGNSDNPRPIITQTSNVAANEIFITSASSGRWNFKNLAFQNSGTKSLQSVAIKFANVNWVVVFSDCVFGDATNQLENAVWLTATATIALIDCEIKNCVSDGFLISGGNSNITVDGCSIHNNGGCGINLNPSTSSITIQNCIIYNNTSDGISFATGGTVTAGQVTDNVIDGNGGNGINLGSSVVHTQLVIYNNNITGNSLYGISTTVTAQNACKAFIDFNCFGSGSATDGPANSSGAYQNITAGAHDKIGISPNYVNRTASPPNFTNSSTSNVKAKGFPDASRMIGGNTSATVAHDDIGVQHADAGGGSSSVILSRVFGGF